MPKRDLEQRDMPDEVQLDAVRTSSWDVMDAPMRVRLPNGRYVVPGRPCLTCSRTGFVRRAGELVACPACNPPAFPLEG